MTEVPYVCQYVLRCTGTHALAPSACTAATARVDRDPRRERDRAVCPGPLPIDHIDHRTAPRDHLSLVMMVAGSDIESAPPGAAQHAIPPTSTPTAPLQGQGPVPGVQSAGLRPPPPAGVPYAHTPVPMRPLPRPDPRAHAPSGVTETESLPAVDDSQRGGCSP